MIQTEVVTRYSADAGQLLASLEQIKASQSQLSSTVDKQTAALSAQNKKLNESVAFWGKLNVGIAMLPGILGKVQSAFDEAATLLQMKSAAAGVNIERLDDALKGQLKTTELYSLAASINSGAIKLNAAQQEVLAGAIRKLGLEGKNTTEVAKDFAKVLQTGEANELKKYGIAVTDLNGKAKDFAAVLRDDLEPMAAKAAATMETTAEQMKAASNDISDGMTQAKLALSEFGAEVMAIQSGNNDRNLSSLSGFLVELAGQGGFAGVASAVREAADEIAMLKRIADIGTPEAAVAAYRKQIADNEAEDAAARAAASLADQQRRAAASWMKLGTPEAVAGSGAKSSGGRRSGESAAEAARRIAALVNSVDAVKLENFAAIAVGSRYDGTTGSGTLQRGVGEVDPGMSREHMAGLEAVLAKSAAANAAIAGEPGARQATFLEKNFGTIESINGYVVAFDALGNAGASAMSAWIDGSMSAGAAIKAALAESVKALAIDMTMKAIQHGAYAIGSLAFGDARGAALHAKSAAMFAAGAIVAGGAAKGMAGSASAGGAAPTLSSGGPTEARGSTPVIVYGDAFADDNPRARARKAKRLLDIARREEGRFN